MWCLRSNHYSYYITRVTAAGKETEYVQDSIKVQSLSHLYVVVISRHQCGLICQKRLRAPGEIHAEVCTEADFGFWLTMIAKSPYTHSHTENLASSKALAPSEACCVQVQIDPPSSPPHSCHNVHIFCLGMPLCHHVRSRYIFKKN